MRKKRLSFPAVLVLAAACTVLSWGQATSDFTLVASPSINIPLGPKLDDGTAFYSLGGGVSLKGEYVLPFAPFLYTGLALDFDLAPINASQKSLTLIAAGPQLGLRFSPVQRLNLKLAGYGGMYFGVIEEGSVRNPFFAGLVDASWLMSPSLSLGLGAAYKLHLAQASPLYQGLSIQLGAQYHVGAGDGKSRLQVTPDILPIFPLFYSYYEKQPAGKLVIRNAERSSLEEVTVSFFVKQYMDQPKVCAQLPSLARGEEKELPVYALFSPSIFSVTEGDKAAGEISVSYRYLGRETTRTFPVTVTINNRNALTWDDDRKAAAFVTAKDPLVLSFAKRIVGGVDSVGRTAVNGRLRAAMGLFQALGNYGLGYVPDPTTPYVDLSRNEQAVDFLQFPGQTLAYKAGDCDDLSALFCALLESVGTPTAFITTPGHIFMAFELGLDPEAARKTFSRPDDLIFRDGKTWVPVEITLVRDGFLKAWQSGAKGWREANGAGQAAFYPVREAWKVYEPVGFSDVREVIMMPDSERILSDYRRELERFIGSEVQIRAAPLKELLGKTPNDSKTQNSLGVLYARYGLLDEAAVEFQKVLKGGEVASALINLGNIHYLKDDMPAALTYYNRALKRSPGAPAALLGVARASFEIEDYRAAESALAALKTTDPQTAAQFSYLGSGGEARAAEAGRREVSEWSDI